MRARQLLAASAAIASGVLLTAACSSSGSSSSSASSTQLGDGRLRLGGRRHEYPRRGGREGRPAQRHHAAVQLGQLRRDHEGLHRQVRHKINDANPEGSSGQEITAVQQLKGQSRAPDVLDLGTPFAVEGAADHLLAPYQVATWSNIPADAKDANGDWYADYGGYVAIGYDPSKVKVAPTSLASLTNPAYKNQIGLKRADDRWCGLRRGLRRGTGERRFVQQHRAGHPVLREAEADWHFVPTAIGGPTTVRTAPRRSSSGGTTCWSPRSSRSFPASRL